MSNIHKTLHSGVLPRPSRSIQSHLALNQVLPYQLVDPKVLDLTSTHQC